MLDLLRQTPAELLEGPFAGAVQTFAVERLEEMATKGRASASWASAGTVQGALTRAKADTVERLAQRQQRVSHVLVLEGEPDELAVVPNDRLALGSRVYVVMYVVNPNALGWRTHLLVDEREGD